MLDFEILEHVAEKPRQKPFPLFMDGIVLLERFAADTRLSLTGLFFFYGSRGIIP